jgi:asparagine synthase (glutamine-hydrolysing)
MSSPPGTFSTPDTVEVVCGICGIVAPGRPPQLGTVEAMAKRLDHRGPDGAGSFAAEDVALAFRRLAIIDLSDAGNQPFASADGRLQLVYNGEIYNYRDLRSELEGLGHRFRSASDTEVVVTAYVEWGERCVERFAGMWAFAIWDARKRHLFASRDRFGIKPFYYRVTDGRLVFASEPKAFLADPDIRLAPNPRAIAAYLTQSYLDHTPETFFRGIERLPAAHSLTFGRDGLQIWRYWSLEPKEPPTGDAGEAVREAFLDSIRLHLRSDVPVGSCLSGGIDSSAVVGAISRLLEAGTKEAASVGPRQRTFTAYFEDAGFDERPYAEQVVAASGAEPHWVTFDEADVLETLPAIVVSQDEPFGSTSMVAQWYVMRAARQAGLTVMLDGQGGDEIFGGYRAFVGFRLADLLAGGKLGSLATELRAFRDVHSPLALATALARPFAPDRLTEAVRSRTRGSAGLLHGDLRGVSSPTDGNASPFRERLRRHQQLLLTQRGLPELLRYEDRNSMAHSLEARVPFLDHRLVELAFSLPGEELIHAGRTKDIVRRALGDLLPPAVRERRDKLGFVTPERRWFRGGLGVFAEEIFASRSFADRGFVDAQAARERLARHRRGEVDAGMELWRALNLELWAQAYLDRPSSPVADAAVA